MGPWGSLVSLPSWGGGDPGANPGGPISFAAARSFTAASENCEKARSKSESKYIKSHCEDIAFHLLLFIRRLLKGE